MTAVPAEVQRWPQAAGKAGPLWGWWVGNRKPQRYSAHTHTLPTATHSRVYKGTALLHSQVHVKAIHDGYLHRPHFPEKELRLSVVKDSEVEPAAGPMTRHPVHPARAPSYHESLESWDIVFTSGIPAAGNSPESEEIT